MLIQSFSRITLFSKHQDVVYFCKETVGKKYPIIIEAVPSFVNLVASSLIIIDSEFFAEHEFFFSRLQENILSKIIFLLLSPAKKITFNFIEKKFSYIFAFPQEPQYFFNFIENILSKEKDYNSSIYEIQKFLNSDSANIFGYFGGSSRIMQNLRSQIRQAANTNYTVLLLGETGSGKTSAARTIHKLSNRNSFSMHSINIATIVTSLAESILFGTQKGSFTDAENSEGLFKVADKSTLFLDEIGTMNLNLQAKLLTVLDDGFINRVGSSKREKVDIRLVCSTNSNIKLLMNNQKFRPDLYYRISDLIISVPPLRNHKEDIRELCLDFTKNTSISFSEEAFRKLENYDWPGNIRDLHQCLKRALSRCSNKIITPDLIDFGIFNEQCFL